MKLFTFIIICTVLAMVAIFPLISAIVNGTFILLAFASIFALITFWMFFLCGLDVDVNFLED